MKQAESNARVALAAAIGDARNERRPNLILLERILKMEHKDTEASKLRSKGDFNQLDNLSF